MTIRPPYTDAYAYDRWRDERDDTEDVETRDPHCSPFPVLAALFWREGRQER
jgi:hypothetical protein